MTPSGLRKILDSEKSQIRSVGGHWFPVDLLSEQQCRSILEGMGSRLLSLQSNRQELLSLKKSDTLMTLLRNLETSYKKASFLRRSNQLEFFQETSKFYQSYGELLRLISNASLGGTLGSVS